VTFRSTQNTSGLPGRGSQLPRSCGSRLLLQERLVFTPRDERRAVPLSGVGDLGQMFSGLIDSHALASSTGTDSECTAETCGKIAA
jgi:hypothetical protein